VELAAPSDAKDVLHVLQTSSAQDLSEVDFWSPNSAAEEWHRVQLRQFILKQWARLPILLWAVKVAVLFGFVMLNSFPPRNATTKEILR
jgi:hypothetical protein